MNILKLRGGCLRINADCIASTEHDQRASDPVAVVTLTSGNSFTLSGDDAKAVLRAFQPDGFIAPVPRTSYSDLRSEPESPKTPEVSGSRNTPETPTAVPPRAEPEPEPVKLPEHVKPRKKGK